MGTIVAMMVVGRNGRRSSTGLLQGARTLLVERYPWTADIPLEELAAAPFPKLVVSGAHNVPFDIQFLDTELKRLGLSPLPNIALDTLTLSRCFLLHDRYSLAALSHDLGFDRPTHRAMSDVMALQALFEQPQGFAHPFGQSIGGAESRFHPVQEDWQFHLATEARRALECNHGPPDVASTQQGQAARPPCEQEAGRMVDDFGDLHRRLAGGQGLRETPQLYQASDQHNARQNSGQDGLAETLADEVALQ